MIAPGMDGEMPAEEWPIKNRTMANWLQDSMNVHFDKVPPSRPYMMPNKVYEFLQKAEDSQDRKTVNTLLTSIEEFTLNETTWWWNANGQPRIENF